MSTTTKSKGLEELLSTLDNNTTTSSKSVNSLVNDYFKSNFKEFSLIVNNRKNVSIYKSIDVFLRGQNKQIIGQKLTQKRVSNLNELSKKYNVFFASDFNEKFNDNNISKKDISTSKDNITEIDKKLFNKICSEFVIIHSMNFKELLVYLSKKFKVDFDIDNIKTILVNFDNYISDYNYLSRVYRQIIFKYDKSKINQFSVTVSKGLSWLKEELEKQQEIQCRKSRSGQVEKIVLIE